MPIDASLAGMPLPEGARTPADFVAAMRALRSWAALTYRELEAKAKAAGDRLPPSTLASALARGSVPRKSTIASFVRACGGDSNAVEVWLRARDRVMGGTARAVRLTDAVEAWLTAHQAARMQLWEADAQPSTYAEGRLASIAAQSTSDRWRGLHRRRSRLSELMF